MKAESIEQIREHLAKGGRVDNGFGGIVAGITNPELIVNSRLGHQYFTAFSAYDWELLPIEPLPGVDAAELPQTTEDPTDLPSDKGRLLKDQQDRIDILEAVLKNIARVMGIRNIRTASVDPYEYERAIIDRYDDILRDPPTPGDQFPELRNKVLHGYTWTPDEQREVWHMLTGETIEPGKRCEACGGEGTQFSELTLERVDCPLCEDHPGYERLPTWMEARGRKVVVRGSQSDGGRAMSHTKGPWYVVVDTSSQDEFGNGPRFVCISRYEDDGADAIAFMNEGTDEDADLIAAAPEMLEALQNALAWYEKDKWIDESNGVNPNPMLLENIQNVDAIIRKATGDE